MRQKQSKYIQAELDKAENYEQWSQVAKRADELSGFSDWKAIDRTKLYDYQEIRSRLESLKELRNSNDDEGLLYALNEGIHGNMGGMGKRVLYGKAMFGTKDLIRDYVDEITSALQHLASPKVDSISIEDKLEFFHRASHCFGRSALLLSGSGSLFYFHLGVVKALWEEDLLPSVITGASGGAIVAAIVGTHTHSQLEEFFEPELLRMELARESGVMGKSPLFFRSQVSPSALDEFFERVIPDLTFQEAAELTGIHINVSVAPSEAHQKSRLLNDIASPNVYLREALRASSAFPGFFPAVTLAAQDQNGDRKPYLKSRKWIDGSVSDDLPIKRVMRLYGVNHSIVSQTNPIALPFIEKNESAGSTSAFTQTFKNTTKEWALAFGKMIDRPVRNHPNLSRLLTMTSSVLSQTYTGDINIIPPKRLHNPMHLLADREPNEILQLIRYGEKATWPQIEAIRIQTKVSKALEQIIKDLEADLYQQVNEMKQNRMKLA